MVAVTREQITVKNRLYTFRPLTLRPVEVSEVDVYLVSNAEDFRGYKAYGNFVHNMWILFWHRGNRYVRIITAGGKKYFIAANHPDRLAAAIRAAKQAAAPSPISS
jgi:hypothetical protein